MKLSRRISLFDQLATMTSAGIPLRQALERAGQHWDEAQVARLLDSLNHGASAAEAFAGAGFSAFETKLIAAAERCGRLEESLRQIAIYWKAQNELAGAMMKNIAYPILLVHLTAILGPLPKIATCGAPLYAATVAVQLAGLYAVGWGSYWLGQTLWRSESGQFFCLGLPLVGRLLRATYAYRWIVALRLGLNCGLSFAQAAADAWEATGYALGRARAAQAQDALLGGERLSALVAQWRELPADWADYLATAEVSGKINETLGHVEASALAQWRRAQERLCDWLPKLLYLALIFFAALQIFSMAIGIFGRVNELLDSVGQ